MLRDSGRQPELNLWNVRLSVVEVPGQQINRPGIKIKNYNNESKINIIFISINPTCVE